MPQVVSNDALRSRLCTDILKGKLSHAYIIEGTAGTGKHLIAKNIAAALSCLCKDSDGISLPCLHCINCRKIMNGISPDVIFIKREEGKAQIGVESVRMIRSDVAIMPNDLDYKIYIIEEADKMTSQAQNALLLTLEEPPEYVVFLLLCESAELLLETVRSRAPILRTEPVKSAEMAEFLCSTESAAARLRASSEKEFFELIAASGGSVGKALSYLDPEKRAELNAYRESVKTFVNTVLGSRSGESLTELTSSLPQKREELSELIGGVMLALRDILLLKRSEDAPLCFYSDREEALTVSELRSAGYILKLYENCLSADDALARNANVKLTASRLVSSGD